MKIQSRFLNGAAGLLTTAALRAWMGTIDYKVAYYDPCVDPAFPECPGRMIYLFWHEYILFPLCLRGHCNLAMLLSRHRDAEVLSYVARNMGFAFVRGSTARGGVAALRQLLEKSRRMHLTITPDGPRGPRRRMAPGSIFLASRLGMPLVPMGYAYDRPWRVHSAWDRFAVPRPFSRARAVIGPPIYVPPNLDRHGLELHRRRLEELMNELTLQAEAWAESRSHREGECRLDPGPVQTIRRPSTPTPYATGLCGPRWMLRIDPVEAKACDADSSAMLDELVE